MSREEFLNRVNVALQDAKRAPLSPVPSSARIAPRVAGEADAEIDMLFEEIRKLSGVARRIADRDELQTALQELVEKEKIIKATHWETREMMELGIVEMLDTLGVQIVPMNADKYQLAECELGITGVDAALAETGTLVLRTTSDHRPIVSLLPRVHLAIMRPLALRADLHPVLAEVKHDRHLVFVTGSSRTSDIEKTLFLGVHGPKSLYVWVCDFES
jgi:L-lactate dehydrogenase complex protein LldG